MSRTIGQAADEYTPAKIGNIAELARVATSDVVETKTYGEGAGAFTIDVIVVDGVDYRVPVSVLGQLKVLTLAEDVKPFEYFRVLKVGTTIQDTKYTVIPLYD